jgi:hypothetical protein
MVGDDVAVDGGMGGTGEAGTVITMTLKGSTFPLNPFLN